ncbi:MAG: FlgD immunoglobulin-like domain containing protein [Bacteroidota bacterium]|nr:FlgD immunoglobulin-like domain containing protein [Bacteroidota bacterium]
MTNTAKVFLPVLLLVLFLPMLGPATAQSFEVASTSALKTGNPSDYLEVKILVTNLTASPLNLQIEITDQSALPEGWETQICFFQNCYPPGVTLKTGQLPASSAELLDIAFATTGTPATGSVKVVVTNTDNPTENVELTFSASTMTTRTSGVPSAGELTLQQNYPNPFSHSKTTSTTIAFRLVESSPVTLKVFNLLGKEVRTLLNEHRPAGRSSASWDGRDNEGRPVPAGIYVYKLSTRSQSLSRRLMITR